MLYHIIDVFSPTHKGLADWKQGFDPNSIGAMCEQDFQLAVVQLAADIQALHLNVIDLLCSYSVYYAQAAWVF